MTIGSIQFQEISDQGCRLISPVLKELITNSNRSEKQRQGVILKMQQSKKSGLTNKKPAYLFPQPRRVSDIFSVGSPFDKLVFASSVKEYITTKCVVFSSLKIVDSKEQDVAFSIVAQKREDTQTMGVVLKGKVPPYGECITLAHFVQALKCVKQHLSTDLSSSYP